MGSINQSVKTYHTLKKRTVLTLPHRRQIGIHTVHCITWRVRWLEAFKTSVAMNCYCCSAMVMVVLLTFKTDKLDTWKKSNVW